VYFDHFYFIILFVGILLLYMLDQQNNPNVKDSDLSYISLVIISNLNCTVVCR